MFYHESHYIHRRYHRSINRITGTVCLILWFLYVWIISPGDSIEERLIGFLNTTVFWPLMLLIGFLVLNAALALLSYALEWLQGYDCW